ncbi:DUF1801 domain-containing protein [Croceimicrobium hydrocarbonivorans]|uniref:DUF1801 domain-containing protein n=1 Tax=Croceimicrobium hydrocarbonivorans TaxID=2761580 RepID=A0A7H0VDF9_9FLAO|nr:DUF1801 domain-containing protein [Croceimicrobium hydrocarbonivorans]QNR23757.1 DUF1801 domain-containing protein [Croceimicrobium hydrocarbonivorans]
MAKELKTKENDLPVEDFIDSLDNEKQKEQSYTLLELFKSISGSEARMWGGSIIGYGHYDYVYSSGQSGTWMRGGFSPRKGKFSLYIMSGFSHYGEILGRLGKYKTGKSCLYINKLEDVDLEVLKELIAGSFQFMKEKYPEGA